MRTRMARMVVPERAEQQHIVQLLRSIGGKVYVLGTVRRRGDFPGTMQTEGLPDVMAFLPRLGESHQRWFLCVEVKRRGGKLRPEQVVFAELCRDADVAHVVGGLDAVIAWLVARGLVRADQFPHYRQPAPASET